MISKPSIAGFGMNWQQCHNMVFVGLSDSYEMMYQAIRRCWRFGQTKPVNVYIITSEAEGSVRENIKRKEQQSIEMFEKLAGFSRASIEKEVRKTYRETEEYNPIIEMEIPQWLLV
jgi:intergrase/recombinase